MAKFDKSLVWFRRDLRSFDHAALHHALKQSRRVYCTFLFDKEILDALPRRDRRVEFILASAAELDTALRELGGFLIVRHGSASEEIPRLAAQLSVDAVYTNHDYEPAAQRRDTEVARVLKTAGCAWLSFKDQVIVEKDEVLTQSGKPFSVFTPYKNAWLKKVQSAENVFLAYYPVEPYKAHFAPSADKVSGQIPSLVSLGFESTNLSQLGIRGGMSAAARGFDNFFERMPDYHRLRDFPTLKGPSYLSVHLRFGTISIRGLVRQTLDAMRSGNGDGASAWLSELIWRDFYFMILHHYPWVVERAFKPEYDAIRWETGTYANELFQAWCEGRTGYPLVDAAMLQLNQTGYMHNRLRMIAASFLIKDLGIDWHRGERYFAQQLNDFDLAANNGGWQWAASSGCDAQPYFRIFNPVTQSQKFDPDGKFICRYLPQLAKVPMKFIHTPWQMSPVEARQAGLSLPFDYPFPIVRHEEARKRTLERYAIVRTHRPMGNNE